MSASERGFTILEAMLAILVLMVGVGALAQLNRGMLRSVSPAGDGLIQHAEIVDLLLRDGAEILRANPNPPLVLTPLVPGLTMSGATYAVRLVPLSTPAAVKGFRRLTYAVEVTYQAPGSGTADLAGSVLLDKVTQSMGTKGGL